MITTILLSAAGIGLGVVLWRMAMAPIDRLLKLCELLVSPPEDWAEIQARPETPSRGAFRNFPGDARSAK